MRCPLLFFFIVELNDSKWNPLYWIERIFNFFYKLGWNSGDRFVKWMGDVFKSQGYKPDITFEEVNLYSNLHLVSLTVIYDNTN